jgi:hypothetical protein
VDKPVDHRRSSVVDNKSCSPWHPISVGCALIIRLIIQTILLDPSGAVWTDAAPNASRHDPSGAVQVDAKHPSHNRKVKVEPTSLRYVGVPPTHLGGLGKPASRRSGRLAPDARYR